MEAKPMGVLGAVAARYRRLVDPRVGVIRSVEEVPPIPGEPTLHMATARLANVDRLYPVFSFEAAAGGTSLDRTEAEVRACGEAVERYCGFVYRPEPELYRAYADLPGRAIAPQEWPRCSDAEYAMPQNPLKPPDPGRPYQWARAWSVRRGEPVFVPALQVSIGYMPPDLNELVMVPHSTGLAAGDSLESATLSGLCEVLERDAFILTWCKQLPAPRLTVPEASWPEVAERQQRVARCGLELQLYALLSERPPAKILALILDRPGGPIPVSCGLGASVDPRRAVAKAIDEAVQSRRAQLVGMLHRQIRVPDRPEDVHSLEDHVGYYMNPERLEAFEFLSRTQTLPAEALPVPASAPLGELVNQLAAQGYEVIRAEVTSSDIAAAGFRVVRVIVPGLLPLAHGHSMRFLACPRWQEFPGRVTSWPHPFG